MQLSWSAPASTGGAAVTSYNVYRGTTAGGEGTTPVATGVTGTSFTDTPLTNGTTYYYTVAAVNAVGTGPQSAEATATPQAGAPSAPLGLTGKRRQRLGQPVLERSGQQRRLRRSRATTSTGAPRPAVSRQHAGGHRRDHDELHRHRR